MKKKTNKLKKLPPIRLTLGQRAADKLTDCVGSWWFIIGLMFFIGIWAYLNVTAFVQHWDPWPFIFLNLFLSCIAAIQAPIILMSQKRSTEKERRMAEYDYKIDRKASKELEEVKKELVSIKRKFPKKKK